METPQPFTLRGAEGSLLLCAWEKLLSRPGPGNRMGKTTGLRFLGRGPTNARRPKQLRMIGLFPVVGAGFKPAPTGIALSHDAQ